MQLPFVLQAAEVVKAALDILEPRLPKGGRRLRGSMVLATVKGDVHDIGKNLVDIILRSNGYRVVNIGTNQGGEEIAAAVEKHRSRPCRLERPAGPLDAGNGGDPAPFARGRHTPAGDLRRGGADPGFRGFGAEAGLQGKGAYAADAFAAMKIMSGAAAAAARPAAGPKKPQRPLSRSVASGPAAAAALLRAPGSCAGPWKRSCPCMDRRVLVKSRWRMRQGAKAEQFFAETLSLLKERGDRRLFRRLRLFRLPPPGQKQPGARIRRPKTSFLTFRAAKTCRWPIISAKRGRGAFFHRQLRHGDLAALEKELFISDRYSRYLLLHGFGARAGRGAGRGDARPHPPGTRPGREARQTVQPRVPGLARPGRPAPASCACSHAGRIGVTLSANDQLHPRVERQRHGRLPSPGDLFLRRGGVP